jgi:hypothetical protein
MSYIFPPTLENGTLKRANTSAEYVRGKILQTLSIIRGELIADPFYGMPIRVFQSINNIGADAARVENILSEEVPEASFRVVGNVYESGVSNLDVFWSYQNTEFTESFEVL